MVFGHTGDYKTPWSVIRANAGRMGIARRHCTGGGLSRGRYRRGGRERRAGRIGSCASFAVRAANSASGAAPPTGMHAKGALRCPAKCQLIPARDPMMINHKSTIAALEAKIRRRPTAHKEL